MRMAIAVEQRTDDAGYGRPTEHAVSFGIRRENCVTLARCMREVRRAFAAATGMRTDRLPTDSLDRFALALYRDFSHPDSYYLTPDSDTPRKGTRSYAEQKRDEAIGNCIKMDIGKLLGEDWEE